MSKETSTLGPCRIEFSPRKMPPIDLSGAKAIEFSPRNMEPVDLSNAIAMGAPLLAPGSILHEFMGLLPPEPSDSYMYALDAFQAASKHEANNPLNSYEGASRSGPHPSTAEVDAFNKKKGQLCFQAYLALANYHIQNKTDTAIESLDYIRRLTLNRKKEFAKIEETKELMGIYHKDWLLSCKAVINDLNNKKLFNEALAIGAIIQPHLHIDKKPQPSPKPVTIIPQQTVVIYQRESFIPVSAAIPAYPVQ